jgi:hypothetical protein
MKPFTQDLYREITGISNRRGYIKNVSPSFITAVRIWQSMLVLLKFDESTFARPLMLPRLDIFDYNIQFDASLTGIGLVIYRGNSAEVLHVGHHMDPYQLYGDSSYQNAMEFIALTCGILCIVRHGARHVSVKVTGDSTTSLKWGSTSRFRSQNSQKTAFLFVSLCVGYDINIIDSEFIPGVENLIPDALSRGSTPATLGFSSCEDFNSSLYLKFFTICDPTILDEDFISQWHDILTFIQIVSHEDISDL